MPRIRPKIILAIAIILPGGGHAALGRYRRALGFIAFMLVLGWITAQLAAPTVSFVGRHAGGFFVYALSITDAYRIAAVAERDRSAPAT
ncbi:MAG TPA: hypothetical protein VHV81_06930 [Steroidobacteraceae bacterium]|nr:hypothetical protein [Steroidobacteraceae bacterium]